jgi:hypothetical protein
LSVQRANDAAAIMAAHQRERFLGYINPTGPQPASLSQTGQQYTPSQYANPEATVNASISSEPTPVITSGAGGSAAATFVTAPATVTGVTSSATATPSPLATQATMSTVAKTAALTPTVSSAATPSPTRAANGSVRAVTSANGAVTITNLPMVIKNK